jgi:hypothetical protein
MKTILFFTLVAASISVAAEEKPYITKTSGGGYVHPDYTQWEKCEVYRDHVLVSKLYGSGDTKTVSNEVRPVKFDGNLSEVVKKAAAEKVVEKDNGLCDGPSTTIKAEDVVIFSTGGCGSKRIAREGPFSRRLTLIVDNYCPTTHDFNRN